MGKEVGESFKREGICVYIWLIHVVVGQKPTQLCKATVLQLKISLKKKTAGLHERGKKRFCASTAESVGSIPGEGTKIPNGLWCGKEQKQQTDIQEHRTPSLSCQRGCCVII